MARALETYRGERRLAWKAALHNHEVHSHEPAKRWETYLRAPHGKLTKSTIERQEREAKERLDKFQADFSVWLLNIGKKLRNRWVLSKREMAVCCLGADANPVAQSAP